MDHFIKYSVVKPDYALLNRSNLMEFVFYWWELVKTDVNIEMSLLRSMWRIGSTSQRSLAAVLLNYFSIG